MTHIIVATHGKFSEEIVNSAAMVFGEDENCHVVTFLPGEGGEHLVEKYNAIIATLPENEPVLFLVDLFGGSPYNAAARVATGRENTDIVTGISLPMLLEVLDAKNGASRQTCRSGKTDRTFRQYEHFFTAYRQPFDSRSSGNLLGKSGEMRSDFCGK